MTNFIATTAPVYDPSSLHPSGRQSSTFAWRSTLESRAPTASTTTATPPSTSCLSGKTPRRTRGLLPQG